MKYILVTLFGLGVALLPTPAIDDSAYCPNSGMCFNPRATIDVRQIQDVR